MRDLLLELGRGFAFVGSQVPLTVANQTFYLDLLFYHVRLHCYVVVELKVGKFKPEYAGKLNFYLSAVDGEIRTERDEPTIGLLLCESHEGAIVEYSFKDITKPIGVASYRVTRELPSSTTKSWLRTEAKVCGERPSWTLKEGRETISSWSPKIYEMWIASSSPNAAMDLTSRAGLRSAVPCSEAPRQGIVVLDDATPTTR